MPRFVKYFVFGMSKTMDIGNTLEVHRIKIEHKTNNISESWKNVGTALRTRLEKAECESRTRTRG